MMDILLFIKNRSNKVFRSHRDGIWYPSGHGHCLCALSFKLLYKLLELSNHHPRKLSFLEFDQSFHDLIKFSHTNQFHGQNKPHDNGTEEVHSHLGKNP